MKTSKQQTSLFTEEKSTSLQEASLASHSAPQESEKEKKTSATCGLKCLEQFGRFNRATLWAKTFSALLIGQEGWYSKRCKLTWKLKGTTCNRLYFRLQASAHPTEEIEYGLLPTVGASDATTGAIIGKNDTFVITSTGMPRKINQNGVDGSVGLARLGKLGMLPTPTADDNPEKNTGKRNQDGLQKRAFQTTGKTSQLNPRFVMEIMGFPPDWTELPFQNGETNQ